MLLNPDRQLYIPSVLHPGWYYQFYTEYGKTYKTKDGVLFDRDGMIYYRYVEKEKVPETAKVWEWVREGEQNCSEEPRTGIYRRRARCSWGGYCWSLLRGYFMLNMALLQVQ